MRELAIVLLILSGILGCLQLCENAIFVDAKGDAFAQLPDQSEPQTDYKTGKELCVRGID
jgi:hypothetical protein